MQLNSIYLSKDEKYIVCTNDNNDIDFISISNNVAPITLRGHVGRVTCLAISSDGKYIVSGSTDSSIILWDASS